MGEGKRDGGDEKGAKDIKRGEEARVLSYKGSEKDERRGSSWREE